jgi:ribosomal protein S18 acetylase RimI-like enzyme
MPLTADPAAIRRILTDRTWAIYALADLAPEASAAAEWHVADAGRPALLLVYRGFRPPVLFAEGAIADLAPLLAEAAQEPELYISVRAEVTSLLRDHGFEIREKRMRRMVVEPRHFTPRDHSAVRLGPEDYEALTALYADGDGAGERPPFFDAGMLRRGVSYGIREGDRLAAAAGTHVLDEQEGVAGIGNVYTRRDRRGRGLGLQVTAAVTAELLQRQIATVALNVEENNAAAIHVYEKLGFQQYCGYREGLAVRRP